MTVAAEMAATEAPMATLTLTAGELLELRSRAEEEVDLMASREIQSMVSPAYRQSRAALYRQLVAKLRAAEETARGGQTP